VYGITDLKKGTVIELDGQPYQVVEYAQKAVGRGGSIVNIKVKNLVDGRVLDKTYKGNEKIQAADIERQSVQFLYQDGGQAHFMNEDTFDQFELSIEAAGSVLPYLPEGAAAQAQLYQGRIIGIELPVKVELKVIETPEVVKGDTQSTVMKTATVETGAQIQVPIFIKNNDTIVVDTRDGSYVERKK
jgi:elongation factor P